MSLYNVQKFLYQLNRDTSLQEKYKQDRDASLEGYTLTDEEKNALTQPDIGLLYVLGVNGQILMHFAALHEMPWDDYLEAMRVGLRKYGQPRAGVYKTTKGF